MDRTQILTKLQQLTGNLKPTSRASAADLQNLQTNLAENIARDSSFNVTGARMHHEGPAALEALSETSATVRHLESVLEGIDTSTERVATRVFRRETEFQNALIGNSAPEWAAGMAPARSFGPFVDEYGVNVWFDFFEPTRLVRVYLKGNSSPALLIPIFGMLTARRSYRIEAGSIWIASNLIAADVSLQGHYTGLRVKRGSLDLTSDAEISAGTIVIKAGTTGTLAVDLDQVDVPPGSGDAGIDADHLKLQLPETLTLKFNVGGGQLEAGNATCRVFGTRADFRFSGLPPVWLAPFSQILVPYKVRSLGDSPNTFNITRSDSQLCQFAEGGKINAGSGWLLPAAKVDPSQLGQAAGTGALLIGLSKGVTANWKGLKDAVTLLKQPGIAVQPGMITVADFFAENLHGKQRWILWKNRTTKHHSDIKLGFSKTFPFIFVSSSSGSESILFFCSHKASFDRPVDANGSPFKIESSIALAGIVQTGTRFRASIYDNDLLFDGNPAKADTPGRRSIILRNALFNVTRPYSLFLSGDLEGDDEITKGTVALLHGIYLYLPTLPDPYVASYTGLFRERIAGGFGNLRLALAGFVKWPNPADVVIADDGSIDETAYVYFKFAPLDQSLLFNSPTTSAAASAPAVKNFQVGVRTFNRSLISDTAIARAELPLMTAEQSLRAETTSVHRDVDLRERIARSRETPQIRSALSNIEADPLLQHISDKTTHVREVMNTALQNVERGSFSADFSGANRAFAVAQPSSPSVSRGRPGLFFQPDSFTLLDVSSHADQMGVSFGAAFRVETDERGEANLREVNARAVSTPNFGSDLPLQILNMDVVATARNVRAVTLPQISWEPISNIPLAIEGPPDPNDLITVTPGLLVYDNDGIATRIFSESPYLVPVTPRSVTRHFVKEFNDSAVPRELHSVFTLPFALIAQADFERDLSLAPDRNTRLSFNRPQFPEVRGGLQIKTLAPTAVVTDEKPSFEGWTFQLDDNIKWFLFGIPIPGSTLGLTVKTIFNQMFQPGGVAPKVPLEHIEFSGYGATIFSNWLNAGATVADVSQAKFDVLVGRTAHEVIQVRSIMYMKTGCVRVVRTITLMRSPNGYVFRSDSGWKAESDAFFDCEYSIAFGNQKKKDKPFEFHRGPINGTSNIRQIRDFPSAGVFKSSFSLKQSGLPDRLGKPNISDWNPAVFANVTSLDQQLPVLLQPVVYDGDVHIDDVVTGGVKDPVRGDYKVQTRKALGYVQLSPARIMIPAHILAELLKQQNGSLGGSVDSTLDIAKSKQTMRLARVDLNPATDASGNYVFPCAARGSLILPQDGSWSVVTQKTDTRDVKPIDEGQTVPLIRRNGEANLRIAEPADVIQSVSKKNYGVLQSTGTQKLLFDTPQFSPNVQKLKSADTYFADAYKLLNAKSVFPNLANALALTNAEKEVEILGEGLMKMADRTLNLNTLLPSNYEYAFIDEPGILRIYAQYKNTGGAGGSLKLGIDSAAALGDKWKAALSNIRIVVDLGPFPEIMWVDGNLNSSSGIKTKYDIPHLQFGPVLEPVIKILQVLATLSGDDFDRGMDVGMSNTPASWEYKFNCSKEIPVIKFPSPTQLTINPNPPLKLEAGLKVGFYFNEVIAIPTDLKQLVPACGAYVDFYGRLQVMCFTLAAASVYAVGQVDLGIAADSKAGISLRMKFGFGVEIVVGLPVVGNVSVLYMVEVEIGISSTTIRVGAFMLFRGQAEICGGLVGVCIQIEAGGAVERTGGKTECIAQVTFAIDICVLWVIDISFEDTWQESRQIA